MNPQLDSYVSQARAAGQNDQQIAQALAQSGWSQMDINQALGLMPPAPSPTAVPPPPPPAHAAPPAPTSPIIAADFFDKKTKDTVMWSVIGYFAKDLISAVATVLGYHFLFPSTVSVYGYAVPIATPSFGFNIGSVIISSIIYGAIFGLVLAKLWDKVQHINHSVFGGWFHSLYRLIFYPALIGGILGLLLAGGLSFSLFGGAYGNYLFMPLLITIVGAVFGSYVYAKLMVKEVGQYYPDTK